MSRVFTCAAVALLLWASLPSPARAELTLNVSPLQDANDIDFGQTQSLGPKGELESDTVVRQVRLTINSTSGQPYQVLQRINEPWKNGKGEDLPLESLRFYATGAGTAGIIQFPNPTQLSVGERELFLSDGAGSSDQIIVTYTIQVPPGQQAGDYRTTVTFRVVSR